eukprot:3991822-Pleurochrysis_carterae.AAC.1
MGLLWVSTHDLHTQQANGRAVGCAGHGFALGKAARRARRFVSWYEHVFAVLWICNKEVVTIGEGAEERGKPRKGRRGADARSSGTKCEGHLCACLRVRVCACARVLEP